MRDDQRSNNPSDPGDRRDAFDDALDDLFGIGVPDDRSAADSPSPPAPLPPTSFDQPSYPPREAGSPGYLAPPSSASRRGRSGPGIRGWTWRKTGCYTCLGFFGVIFACLVILFIIGIVAGDPADPAPAGRMGVGPAIVAPVAGDVPPTVSGLQPGKVSLDAAGSLAALADQAARYLDENSAGSGKPDEAHNTCDHD